MAALILASSCRDEGGLNPPEQLREVSLTADVAATKTTLDGDAVKWEDGDEIALVFTHPDKGPAVETLSTSIGDTPLASADFTGTVAMEILRTDGGYDDAVTAVYPASAVVSDGTVSFLLPADQQARTDGTFADEHNLTSAPVSLADLQDDGKAAATFLNALSVLKFSVKSDVASVTLTGTSPLAGTAPLVLDTDGRLMIDADGSWTGDSQSVTLRPADGSECFTEGVVYHLLVWPGTHTALTATLNFKEYGEYSKTSEAVFTFEASKYYTLNFNTDSETLVSEITSGLDGIVNDYPSDDQLGSLEADAERLSALLSQIQSVVLVSEYLDDYVYAPYATIGSTKEKKDVELKYIIRPAAVAAVLVEKYSEVFSARVYYDGNAGSFSELSVNSVTIDGDILTVKVNASGISDSFYNGGVDAGLALQISDGNTDVLSDFAKLAPIVQAAIRVNYSEDVPAISGASVNIPFSYALADGDTYNFSCSANASVRDNKGTGYFIVNISDSIPVEDQTATLTLTVGGKESVQEFTFVEGGKLEITTDGPVDYIGGEVQVKVERNDFSAGPLTLTNGGGWCSQSSMIFTCTENSSSSSRTATADYKISYRGLTYTKTIKIVQNGTSAGLTRSYYSNGEKAMLMNASPIYNPLNIVILGDGYQKKDLSKGGKFERAATSACQTFFSIEPFNSFRDRFNVYMVAYESAEEGIDIKSQSVDKDTYYETYWDGNTTAAYLTANGISKVNSIVKNTLGLDTDAEYYRTIVLILSNTDAVAGSCGYPYRELYGDTSVVGEPYASFAIAVLPANSTGTNGLIKHELGGHGFGRLGDEYEKHSYGSDLETWHGKGFYRNVTINQSAWNWNSFSSYSGYNVEYIWRNNNYWCPSNGGIMYNNQGVFNAPSRQIIYERIIRQTEGASAYSFSKFIEYDKKNL